MLKLLSVNRLRRIGCLTKMTMRSYLSEAIIVLVIAIAGVNSHGQSAEERSISSSDYLFVKSPRLTNDGARNYCLDRGMDLVSIDSQQEMDYLKSKTKRFYGTWTGGRRILHSSFWRWLPTYEDWDAKNTNRYTNWASGEPNNNGGNEDCMIFRGSSGLWDDRHCGAKNAFVCEKSTGTVVTCKLTADNEIKTVSYNGIILSVTGDKRNWQKQNTFQFETWSEPEDVLSIAAEDWNNSQNCIWGGLLLHCQAKDTSSPWHNFKSSTDHWQTLDGSELCSNSDGFVSHRFSGNIPFIRSLLASGSKKIWSAQKKVTLIGSPSEEGRRRLLAGSKCCTVIAATLSAEFEEATFPLVYGICLTALRIMPSAICISVRAVVQGIPFTPCRTLLKTAMNAC